MGSEAGPIFSRKWLLAVEIVAVLAIALAARVLYPNPWTHTDEHFHLLAARSLLSDGTLKITPEALTPYTRACGFTAAVAASQWVFGDSLWAGRLPSMLAGITLIAGVFVFLRRHADRAAAWGASMLLCFSLPALQLSEMARFYMPHALAVWLLAWAAYETLAAHGRGRRWLFAGLTLLATALAFHLQPTSAIACAGLAVWVAGWWLCQVRRGRIAPPGPRGYAVAAAVLLVGLAAMWFSGFLPHLWDRYRAPRVWAQDTVGDYAYYHRLMLAWRPLLYALLPAAAVTAIRLRPTPATWAFCLFLVPWIIHSLISPKADRYVFYALPFFYAVLGMALPVWARGIRDMTRSLLLDAAVGRRAAAAGAALAVAAVIAFPLAYVQEYRTALKMLRGDAWASPYRSPNWTVAARKLAPQLDPQTVVVGSMGMEELYYLGRLDAALNVSALKHEPEPRIIPSLGRPAIASPQALARLIADHPKGLVVIARSDWRDPVHVPDETADFIEANLDRLPDPVENLRAYRWPRTDNN